MRTLVYGSLIVAAVQLLTRAQALECPGSIVCIHDNDGTQVCPEVTSSGTNCPAGTHVDPSVGTLLPVCASGNVACEHLNDGTTFCFPGYLCPAGSLQLSAVDLPQCPAGQQMCVYGPMYGCFDYACPSGMTPYGFMDCTVAPKTCEATERLCVYDIGNAFACQSQDFPSCWPGTHEWKPCTARFDYTNNLIVLATGHFIKCFAGLEKKANGNVFCGLPLLDSYTWPSQYANGKYLYIYECGNGDNSGRHIIQLAKEMGFSSYTGVGSVLSTGYSSMLPNSWLNSYFSAGAYPEYCIIDNQLVYWTDPRCKVNNFNANCFLSRFEFVV